VERRKQKGRFEYKQQEQEAKKMKKIQDLAKTQPCLLRTQFQRNDLALFLERNNLTKSGNKTELQNRIISFVTHGPEGMKKGRKRLPSADLQQTPTKRHKTQHNKKGGKDKEKKKGTEKETKDKGKTKAKEKKPMNQKGKGEDKEKKKEDKGKVKEKVNTNKTKEHQKRKDAKPKTRMRPGDKQGQDHIQEGERVVEWQRAEGNPDLQGTSARGLKRLSSSTSLDSLLELACEELVTEDVLPATQLLLQKLRFRLATMNSTSTSSRGQTLLF